jgi:hypothetical protein
VQESTLVEEQRTEELDRRAGSAERTGELDRAILDAAEAVLAAVRARPPGYAPLSVPP